ncbi:MAG: hypothetical protein PHP45_06230 [Elusimicrobiales bacterium]|nr:hypothetical protein [Elusimicrobiales bacterium]
MGRLSGLKNYFSKPIHASLLFFLIGIILNHHNIVDMLARDTWPRHSQGILLFFLMSGMGAYTALLFISLGGANIAIVLGGGLGILAGELILPGYKRTALWLLLTNDISGFLHHIVYNSRVLELLLINDISGWGLGLKLVKPLVVGIILGWVWSKISEIAARQREASGKQKAFSAQPDDRPPNTENAPLPLYPARVILYAGVGIAALPLLTIPKYVFYILFTPAWRAHRELFYGNYILMEMLPLKYMFYPGLLITMLSALMLQSAWFALPFLVWYSIARKIKSSVTVIISGAILLLCNLYIVVSLHFVPIANYSGAAHTGMFFPPIEVLVMIPTAFFAGWLITVLAPFAPISLSGESKKKIVKAAVILAAAALILGHKPLNRFMNIRARIGKPRIVLGGETFKKTDIEIGRVIEVGDFDGDSLEEIAVDCQKEDRNKRIRLPDALRLRPRARNREPDAHEIQKIRLLDTHDFSVKKEWSDSDAWLEKTGPFFMAVPVRLKAKGDYFLNRHSGSLHDFKGNAIWTFKYCQPYGCDFPVQAADLDNDGETEFYAKSHGKLYRVDERGKMQWTIGQSISEAYPLPAKNGDPAMIFTREDSGNQMQLWSPEGKLLREFKFDKAGSELYPINWSDSYCFATNHSREFYIFDLTGKIVLEGKVGKDMSLRYKGVSSMRFATDEKPYLVVRAYAGDSVDRQEIDIYSSDDELVYREILNDKYDYSFNAATDHVTGRGYFILGDTKYEKAVSPQNNLPAAMPRRGNN